MHAGQEGIVASSAGAAKFLVLRVSSLSRQARAVAARLAEVPALTARVAARAPEARLHCVVGVGSELWAELHPGRGPRELGPFKARAAGAHRMPATGGDLFFHIHASRPDLCFELGSELVRRLEGEGGKVEVVEEVDGFVYLDERDLTGFIDGTENPKGREERVEAALIGAEDPAHEGGSYVLAMRFVHQLDEWRRLSDHAQERVIGRTKVESEELSDEEKPASAHIARVVIEKDGEELEIVRHSLPYGSTREAGLFFLAYCRSRATFDQMLAGMLGEEEGAPSDALLDYTRAVSGSYFYAPSHQELLGFAQLP